MSPRDLLRDRSGYQGWLGTTLWARLSTIVIDMAKWKPAERRAVRQLYCKCTSLSSGSIYCQVPCVLAIPPQLRLTENQYAYCLVS